MGSGGAGLVLFCPPSPGPVGVPAVVDDGLLVHIGDVEDDLGDEVQRVEPPAVAPVAGMDAVLFRGDSLHRVECPAFVKPAPADEHVQVRVEVQEAAEGLDADYRPGRAGRRAEGFTDKVAHGLVPAPGQFGKEGAVVEEVRSEAAGDGEHHLAVGYGRKYIFGQKRREFGLAL
ncbi:MAG: hypothetical protein V1800_13640 [Candidatus Latescibacterota bacterium]